MQSEEGPTTPQARGRAKACNECRQSKLRCDKHLVHDQPCTRCQQKGKQCVVNPGFRRKKRLTKQQMWAEIERLKQEYSIPDRPDDYYAPSTTNSVPASATSSFLTTSSFQDDSVAPSSSPHLLNNGLSSSTPRRFAYSTPQALYSHGVTTHNLMRTPKATSEAFGPPLDLNELPSRPTSSSSGTSINSPALPAIDGIGVDRTTISHCFTLFFEHYAAYLPDVFPEKDPDVLRSQSEFLFWSIVFTGARRFQGDREFVDQLADPLLQLAAKSLFDPEADKMIPTVVASLILCMWPLPNRTLFNDPSTSFAATAMQLAIRCGLHMCHSAQDFTMTQFKADKDTKAYRSRLWVACVMVCQSANIFLGLPTLSVSAAPYCTSDAHLDEIMPPFYVYNFKLHLLRAEAVSMFNTLDKNSPYYDSSLFQLMKTLDDRVMAVPCPKHISLYEEFEQNCTRLFVWAFCFFIGPSRERQSAALNMHTHALLVIRLACAMDKSEDERTRSFALHSCQYTYILLFLAVCCLLRVSRTQLLHPEKLDLGEQAVAQFIDFLERRAISDNDLNSQTVKMTTEIWNSQKAFSARGQTHLDPLSLHVKGRLNLSVAYDSIWWWRTEFENASKASFDNLMPPQQLSQPPPYSLNTIPANFMPPMSASMPQNYYLSHDAHYENPLQMDWNCWQSIPPNGLIYGSQFDPGSEASYGYSSY